MKVSFLYVRALPDSFSDIKGVFTGLDTEIIPLFLPESLDEVGVDEAKTLIAGLVSCDRMVFSVPEGGVSDGILWFLSGYTAGRNTRGLLYLFNPGGSILPWWLSEVESGKTVEELAVYFRMQVPVWKREETRKAARNELIVSGLALTEEAMAAAVVQGMEKSVHQYLVAGFSCNAASGKGLPVLTLAVRGGHTEIARLLLEAGADIDKPAPDSGNTPLMDAVVGELKDLVYDFIGRKASLNIQNKNGQTALILAVGKANQEFTDILLENGADTEITDSLDMSALKYAELFKYKELIPLLTGTSNRR